MTLTRVGFMGVGTMGSPMISAIASYDFELKIYDIDVSRAKDVAASTGCQAVGSPDALADRDVVICMLSDSDVVEAALLGSAGIASILQPGTTVIDMSSSSPLRTRDLGPALGTHGLHLVDAPVSGGLAGARARTLTIMVGGTARQFHTVLPLLSTMAGSVVHTGPLGTGHATKALNNLLSATSLLAAAEAVEAGRRFGIDPETLIEVINRSTGRSVATEVKFPRNILTGSFDSGFALRLMTKDVRIAAGLVDTATGRNALAPHVLAAWQQASEQLPPTADQTEIARLVFGTARVISEDLAD